MKKVHKLIITTYLGPFILTFFITLFILVMQFLWKYIDDLVGKGLEWYIITELLFYASANLVPLALPLAILLSSIMTFGNLGEHYELVALKSAGLSIARIMKPLFVVILITSLSAFYFSNNIWPVANLKFASLLYDVRQKKPALDIKSGVFYNGIDDYVIRIGDKDNKSQMLYDVLIYDHTQRKGNNKVIKAEKGRMQMSKDERFLVLTLFNGSSYEDIINDREEPGNPMFRTIFKEEIIRFDLSGFSLERTDEDLFKDNYQMLNIKQLDSQVDTLNQKLDKRKEDYNIHLAGKFTFNMDTINPAGEQGEKATDDLLSYFSNSDQSKILETAVNMTRGTRTYVNSLSSEFESRQRNINRHKIEWHRKFTLSIACIVLFFIGAPLGAIIRKGGLGMPVVVSVGFFLVFHVLSITGEKLSKQGELPPWQGMWMATVLLIPIGLFLTYKAATDSALMEMETYGKVIKSLGRLLPGKGRKAANTDH